MYFINEKNTPETKPKHKSQVLLGWMVLACSMVAVPVAEAAKPVAVIGKVAAVDEGALVTLDGSGSSDKDGNKLTYQWLQTAGTPTVTLLKATTATASFTAPAIAKTNKVTKPAALKFQLTVNDGTSSVNKSVSVVVKPVNQLPVANAGSDKTVTYAVAASSIALDGSKSKDDGQIVKYQWKLLTKGLPKGTKLKLSNANAAAASFTLASPNTAASVTLEFELQVTDNDRKLVKDTVSFTVLETLPTPAPVANAGSDQTVISEAAVSLSGAQSAGAITSYAWKQTAGPTVALSSTNAAATSFTAPIVTAATALTFELTTANSAGSSKDTVVVTVNPKPAALPVANAGIDQAVAGGTTVNLSGSLSTGVITGYQWRQSAGTTVNLSSTNTVATSFIAPTVTAATPLTFELTATNAAGSSKDTVVVTVNAQASVLDANLSLPVGMLDINDPTVAAINSISGGTGPYSVTYDWGDGQTTGPVQLGAGVITHSNEHYYAKNASYTIKVKLADANKLSKEFSGPVTVSDVEECK